MASSSTPRLLSKPQQILNLNPASEILFEGPFDKVVTSYLEVSNPSQNKVGFKVKTTAPRRYCVRPNSGIVSPGAKMKVAIMLQPIEQESQAERSKHKFMVQSTVISDEDISLDEIWKTVIPETIMDSKLRCVFQEEPDVATEHTSQQQNLRTNATTTAEQQTTEDKAKVLAESQKTSTSASDPQKTQNKSAAGDARSQQPITSTPTRPSRYVAASVSSTSSPREQQNLSSKPELRSFDRSIASSQNLTSSFLQPMSNDHKIVLVSLIMLILGVILGKYII